MSGWTHWVGSGTTNFSLCTCAKGRMRRFGPRCTGGEERVGRIGRGTPWVGSSHIHVSTCSSSVLQFTLLPCALLKPCLCLCLSATRSVPDRYEDVLYAVERESVLVHVIRMLASLAEGFSRGTYPWQGREGRWQWQVTVASCQLWFPAAQAGSEMYIAGAPSALRSNESGRAQACWYLCWRPWQLKSRRALACRAHTVQRQSGRRRARRKQQAITPTLSGAGRQRHGHARLQDTDSKRGGGATAA
jgi:hypothetical protein